MFNNNNGHLSNKKQLTELLDTWVSEIGFENIALLDQSSDPNQEREKWIIELTKGKEWLEGQANNWQMEAERRGVYIEQLRNWIAELESGKSWLESQVSNWQTEAERQGKYIGELKNRIAELEDRRHS